MKTFETVSNAFYISPALKALAFRGSSNSETVCFKLNRFTGRADLAECSCTVKTKSSAGKSDIAIPDVTADDKTLCILWTLSSGATAAAGPLLVQIQFDKVFPDSSKNINWQSNIMEFQIPDSLDAADEIEDQGPTVFQQWEKRVGTLCADAAASMQAVAAQAQSSAACAASSAAQAQQKADSFSGYTKEKIDNGFAAAIIGEASGQTILLDDIQPGTNLRSLLIAGQTVMAGSGDRSPDHPYTPTGTASLTVSDSKNQPQPVTLPQALLSLPDGTADSYDTVSGAGMQKVGTALLNGSENEWHLESNGNADCARFSIVKSDMAANAYLNIAFSNFAAKAGDTDGTGGNWYQNYLFLSIAKSRLSGWSEGWTYAQKVAAFRTWLAANPVTVLYPLATPRAIGSSQTFSAAGLSPSIRLSADAGSMQIEYVRDSNAVYRELIRKIEALNR